MTPKNAVLKLLCFSMALRQILFSEHPSRRMRTFKLHCTKFSLKTFHGTSEFCFCEFMYWYYSALACLLATAACNAVWVFLGLPPRLLKMECQYTFTVIID